ncbi:ROK family protein [Nocardioides marinquilinus]|uniref:ROK family protein n=1 Tax=Nocardioides marinquilinus TaxID=1210400 RepID=A0ABP9P790_9ACTN
MMLVLALGPFGAPSSRILTHVRRSGALTRDELARKTGLSVSTVGRTVTALAEQGLLRERPDLVPEGSVGRPNVPVDLDDARYVTLGVHVGRRAATLALGDLRGRVIASAVLDPRGHDAASFAVAAATGLTRLLATHSTRIALSAGLVAPWGDVDLDRDELTAALEGTLGLEVESWELVPAIAAAEYIARPDDLPGSTLYVYARDTVGFVMANERPWGMEIARAGRLSHFPAGGTARCHCGQTGCLEAVASEYAVARAAATGVRPVIDAAVAGDDVAHQVLCERAAVLGRVTAAVRDMLNPDRVVLCGQGFTAYPPALDVVRTSFARHSATPGDIDVAFTRVSGEIQAVAAGTVALRRVYDDPQSALAEIGLDDATEDRGSLSR